jgi:hypothetical protein
MILAFSGYRRDALPLALVLGMTAWILLSVPKASGAEERTGTPESAERPFLERTEKEVIKEAREAPKAFKEYFLEKVEQARQEPWRETADEILIKDSEVRWHRHLRALANTPQWLDIGLAHRMRYEVLTNNFRINDATNINGGSSRTRLRLGADWNVFRLLVEAQNSSSIAENTGATSTVNSSLLSGDRMLQAFVAVKLENVLNTGLRTDLHAGRMTLDFGNRRLIARNEFRNTTNSFVGGHWNLAQEGTWGVRSFLVKPLSDSFGVLTPVSDTLFWGIQYEDHREPWLQTDLYYFGINAAGSGSNNKAFGTYGFRLYRSPAPGRLDYENETAFQVGSAGGKDLFAYFVHADFGYSFALPWQPHLQVQYDYASGTANPAGNSTGTFDTLFGARNFEYSPTSIFGPFFRSNISTPGVRLSLEPRETIGLTLKYRAWYLAQSKDAWVGSGLQDPTGASGNFLGQDVELRGDWHWNTFALFRIGYDHLFKGSYMQNLARVPGNPPAKDSDYFYVQTELRF